MMATRSDLPRILMFAVVVGSASCNGEAPSPRMPGASAAPVEADQPAGKVVPPGVALEGPVLTLEPGRAVVVPDTTAQGDWLESVAQLAFDFERRQVLVLNQGSAGAVEFTIDGQLVRRFAARAGAGPGEIRRAERFAFNQELLAIHDRGAGKLVVFDRSTGAHRRDVRLPRSYSDVALAPGSGTAYLVPGAAGSAFDVLDVASGAITSAGALNDLPLFCHRSDCTPRSDDCRGCRIQALGDSLVAVLNTDIAALVTFDREGMVRARLPFDQANPVLRRWRDEDAPLLARARAGDGPGAFTFKSYFMDIDSGPDGRVVVPVLPSRKLWEARGNELWLIDPLTGHQERHVYPRREVGFLGVLAGREVVALDPRDGGIHRFAMPPGRRAHRRSRRDGGRAS